MKLSALLQGTIVLLGLKSVHLRARALEDSGKLEKQSASMGKNQMSN